MGNYGDESFLYIIVVETLEALMYYITGRLCQRTDITVVNPPLLNYKLSYRGVYRNSHPREGCTTESSKGCTPESLPQGRVR